MKRWTTEEEQMFICYAFQNDEERVSDAIEYAHHMMYLEGNNPEFVERNLSACVSKYYKLSTKIKK